MPAHGRLRLQRDAMVRGMALHMSSLAFPGVVKHSAVDAFVPFCSYTAGLNKGEKKAQRVPLPVEANFVTVLLTSSRGSR